MSVVKSPAEILKEAKEHVEKGMALWGSNSEMAKKHLMVGQKMFNNYLNYNINRNDPMYAGVVKSLEERIAAIDEKISKIETGEKPPGGNKNDNNGNNGKDSADDEDDRRMMAQIKQSMVTEKPKERFADCIGLEDLIEEVRSYIINPLKFKEIYKDAGMVNSSNFLLHGPPGTGKSFFAKAVAGELKDSTFFALSGANMKSKYVGDSEKIIKSVFKIARESAKENPVIIFMDEVDAVASARTGESNSSQNTLNQLLVEMDGFTDSANIYVICASNVPQNLDGAFLRRCQRKFYMKLPDVEARFKLWKMYASIKGKLSPHISEQHLSYFANRSHNYSPADIKNVCQAAIMDMLTETTRATHFIQVNDQGQAKFMPVADNHPNATRMNIDELDPQLIVRVPLQPRHIENQLNKYHPGVSEENLKLYQDFQESKS